MGEGERESGRGSGEWGGGMGRGMGEEEGRGGMRRGSVVLAYSLSLVLMRRESFVSISPLSFSFPFSFRFPCRFPFFPLLSFPSLSILFFPFFSFPFLSFPFFPSFHPLHFLSFSLLFFKDLVSGDVRKGLIYILIIYAHSSPDS